MSAERFPEWLLRLLVVLCASTIAIAGVEIASWGYARWDRPDIHGAWPGDHPQTLDPSAEYGYALPRSATIHALLHTPDGGTCYDVTYHTDDLGRRTLGQQYDPRNPHLVLFGCSFTMGEGLDDGDTLAAQLATRIPGYNIYDYAVHGYGPQHMLARLQTRTLASEVESGRGLAVYILLPFHVDRVIGNTRASWVYRGPYYLLDSSDALVRRGSFVSGRPYTTTLYRVLAKLKDQSWFFTLFGPQLPPRLTDQHAELTARILEASRIAYREQLDGDLYVVFHPGWALGHPEDRRLMEVIRRHLAAAGVPMLDYSTDQGLDDAERIGRNCDPHPNGTVNARLADLLARDLPLVH